MQPTRFAVLSGRLMPTLAGLLKKRKLQLWRVSYGQELPTGEDADKSYIGSSWA
jgi:hypothetical protein